MLIKSKNTIGTARTDKMIRAGMIPAVILSSPPKASSCGPLTELFLPVRAAVGFGMKRDWSVTLTDITELCVEGSKIPVALTWPRRVEPW